MNKAELIEAVSRRSQRSKAQAGDIVNAMMLIISETEVLRVRVLFTNAKHKLKTKTFRGGLKDAEDKHMGKVAERVAPYSPSTEGRILNYGAVFPHDTEK